MPVCLIEKQFHWCLGLKEPSGRVWYGGSARKAVSVMSSEVNMSIFQNFPAFVRILYIGVQSLRGTVASGAVEQSL